MTSPLEDNIRAALRHAGDGVPLTRGAELDPRYTSRRARRRDTAVAAMAAGVVAVAAGGVTMARSWHPGQSAQPGAVAVGAPAPQSTTGPGVAAPMVEPTVNPGQARKLQASAPALPELDRTTAREALQSCIDRERQVQTLSDKWNIEAAVQLPSTTITAANTGNVTDAPPSVFVAAHEVGTNQALWCIVSGAAGAWRAGEGGMQPLWLPSNALPAAVVPVGVQLGDYDQELEAGYVAKGVTRVSVSLHGVDYPAVVRHGFYFAVLPQQVPTGVGAPGPAVPATITAYNAANTALTTTASQANPLLASSCYKTPSGVALKPMPGRALGASTSCAVTQAWAGAPN